MAKKDCEFCNKHRARWLVEVVYNETGEKRKLKVCGICKWKLWPSPRKRKPIEVVRVLARIRGSPETKRKPLPQPHIYISKREERK